MKNLLKIWLRKNELTSDPNDYVAVVSSMGSLNKQGLIDLVMGEGIELKRETVEDVVTRYSRIAARYATTGWNVDTGLVYLRPIVTGNFLTRLFDPAKNSIYVSAVQGVELRREIAETAIEVLGELPDVMYILQVINLQSRVADGTITSGRNAQVEGAYIKIAGKDDSIGVYLVNTETGAETKLDPDLIAVNDPSKLILLIPVDLEPGTYNLKIVTQFTGAGKFLKAPRQVVFSHELTLI
jgi:hypothetical protein